MYIDAKRIYVFYIDGSTYPGLFLPPDKFVIATSFGIHVVDATSITPVSVVNDKSSAIKTYGVRFEKLLSDLLSRVIILPDKWGPTKVKKFIELIETVEKDESEGN